jgi:hypothetical protein
MLTRNKSFFLLFILALPMLAPLLLWEWQDYAFKRDFKNSVKESNLVLEVNSLDGLKWMDGREELQIGNEYYDVVSIKKSGSRYQLALKADSLESAVMEIFAGHQKKQQTTSYLVYFVSAALPIVHDFNFESPLTQEIHWKTFTQYSFLFYLNQVSPPPNLFCC